MISHFRVPGEATRRDYAVYIMVATCRVDAKRALYVGKTGDNHDGCNPIISRAGNHLSFNKLHSQARNRFSDPENYDFDFFYTAFGAYVPKHISRDGLNTINTMERELNTLVQEAFPGLLRNPVSPTYRPSKAKRAARESHLTAERREQLNALVRRVQEFIGSPATPSTPSDGDKTASAASSSPSATQAMPSGNAPHSTSAPGASPG